MTARKKPAAKAAADPAVCGECGERHVTKRGGPSCSGHSRGRLRPEIAGKPCTQPRMRGQKVCKVHGGMAPQAKAAAEERIERAKVEALARTFGEPIEGKDPGEIVAEQIAWRYGHVAWLRARVQALEPRALVWGRTKEKIGGEDGGLTFEAKVNAWLAMYLDASRDLEKLCLEAIKAGLEERRVRIAEQSADVLVRMLDGLLVDLGLDPDNQETARVVERHLAAVAS